MSYEQADALDQFEYAMRAGTDLKTRLVPIKIVELSGALLTALESLGNSDALNRAATMLLKILSFDRTSAGYVVDALGENAFQPFLVHFSGSSASEVAGRVATAMAILLCSPNLAHLDTKELIESQTVTFMKWTCDVLAEENVDTNEAIAVLTALGHFLRTDANRLKFIEQSKGTMVVGNLLEKQYFSKVQLEYQAVFAFWLLSFTGTPEQTAIVEKVMSEAEVARRMTTILREIPAEKVVRISLSVLRNLAAEKFGVCLRREMIGAGLVDALEQLCLRRWNDGDIRDDLSALAELLQKELLVMSTFDVYRSEVLSGALAWTPAHKDETFWRENTEKMERNNMELLRCLVRALHESSDSTVLSVACYDLGMFIKHHPRGRLIAQSLGVKPRLMELMTSPDQEVRRQALTCVQILMISHYNLIPTNKK